MKASIWRGERVRLRAVEPSHWEVSFRWNQDDDQSRRLYFIPFPLSAEATRRQAEENATKRPESDSYNFIIENGEGIDGRHFDMVMYGITAEEFMATEKAE